MAKKDYKKEKSTLFLFIPVFILLGIGILVLVIQLQQQQNTQSRADTATAQTCTVAPANLAISTQEQKMFDDINNFRSQNNLPPVASSAALNQAAAWLSNDMLNHNNLSHTDSLNRGVMARLSDCGLPNTSATGEIIDSGNADPDTVIAAWEHSQAQTDELLNTKFTQVGIALSSGSATSQYWTVDFSGTIITPTTVPSNTPTPSQGPGSPTPTTGPTHTPIPSTTKAPTATPKPTGPTATPSPTAIFRPTTTPLPTGQFLPTSTPTPPNTPTPTVDPSFIANPSDMQIFVAVKFPGIGSDGNINPHHLTRRIQATIYGMDNASVVTGTGDLKFDGNMFRGVIHLGKLKNDNYYLKVGGDRTLQAYVLPEFQHLDSSRLNVLPEVYLVAGDLDVDNIVSITDFDIALKCFQDNKCGVSDENTQDMLDFNDDGIVNVADYNILLNTYWSNLGD